MTETKNEEQNTIENNGVKSNVIPHFYLRTFHRGTPHQGWQIGILGWWFEYNKTTWHWKKYAKFKTPTSMTIYWLGRSIWFGLGANKNVE